MLADGGLKGAVQLAQPVLQDVGEANQDRQVDAAEDERIDQLLQVDRASGILFRVDADMSVLPHREVSLAPTSDIVEVAGQLRGPSFGGLHDQGAFAAISFQCLPVSFTAACRGNKNYVTRLAHGRNGDYLAWHSA